MSHATPHRPLLRFCLSLFLLLTLCATGCAVLKVDVDLYKGSLSKEQDVQIQSTAALAIAAKPLLVELRDTLEEAERVEANKKRSEDDQLEKFKELDLIYEPSYIATHHSDDTVEFRFESSQADQINDILGLYEDAAAPEMMQLIAEAREHLNLIDEAKQRFKQNDVDNRIIGELKRLADQEDDEAKKKKIQELGQVFIEDNGIREGVKEFAENVLIYQVSNIKILGKNIDWSLINFGLHPYENDYFQVEWANKAFDTQSNQDGVEIYLRSILTDDKAFRNTVLQRLVEIGDAFHASREQTRQLYETALRSLEALGQATSDSNKQVYREQVALALVRIVTYLTQTNYLTEFLNHDVLEAESRSDGISKTTISRFVESLKLGDLRDSLKQAKGDYRVEMYQLDQWLREPVEDQATLVTLGQRAAKLRIVHETRIYIQDEIRFRYGLSRTLLAADESEGDLFEFAELQQLAKAYASTSGSAFGRGRLHEGIETLIDRFIDVSHSKTGQGDLLEDEATTQLLEALARFGQKTVYLANNIRLIQTSKEDTKDKDKNSIYIKLLQSIGNAVITQVDELEHRSAYQDRQDTASELQAYNNHTGPMTPDFEVQNLLVWLSEQEQAAAKKKDALPKSENEEDETEVAKRLSAEIARFKAATKLTSTYAGKAIAGAASDADKVVPNLMVSISGDKSDLVSNTEDEDKEEKNAVLRRGAMQALASYMHTVGTPGLPQSGINEDNASDHKPKDVIDGLIRSWQYEYLLAVRRTGADSERAKLLERAIEETIKQRRQMVRLRNPGVFLASSYPVTALQDDPGVNWRSKNMLSEQVLKSSLPFYETWQNHKHGEEIKQQTYIDQQFWQTINQVRVSGGGDTNYVIARDDLGNWNVKRYSADPKEIYDSVASLAKTTLLGGFEPENFEQIRKLMVPSNEGAPEDLDSKSLEQEKKSLEHRQILMQYDQKAGELIEKIKKQLDEFKNGGGDVFTADPLKSDDDLKAVVKQSAYTFDLTADRSRELGTILIEVAAHINAITDQLNEAENENADTLAKTFNEKLFSAWKTEAKEQIDATKKKIDAL